MSTNRMYFLPPGPWEVRGNKVVTGTGQTIAVIFFPRHAHEIAREIAKVPDYVEEIEELKSEVEDLKEQAEEQHFRVEFGDE